MEMRQRRACGEEKNGELTDYSIPRLGIFSFSVGGGGGDGGEGASSA